MTTDGVAPIRAKAPIAANDRGLMQKTARINNNILRGLLRKLDDELVVVELGAWATYFGDPLPEPDRDRVLLACRRLEAIRGCVNARL